MIPVSWLAPEGCWDQTVVKDLLDGILYPHNLVVKHHRGYAPTEGTVVVVPGRFWNTAYDQIADALSRYEWVLGLRVSDEEDWFNPTMVEHPNAKWWIQTPRFQSEYPNGSRFLPVGYTPHARFADPSEKLLDVFLSGQDTHRRRHECFDTLEGLKRSRIHRTAGFTQGMDAGEYVRCCGLAKLMPCPSGAVSVDSFRVWEALEADAIPVVDKVSPVDGPTNYWERVLQDPPFPLVHDWGAVDWVELLDGWDPEPVQGWYRSYKRRLADWLVEDLTVLGAV